MSTCPYSDTRGGQHTHKRAPEPIAKRAPWVGQDTGQTPVNVFRTHNTPHACASPRARHASRRILYSGRVLEKRAHTTLGAQHALHCCRRGCVQDHRHESLDAAQGSSPPAGPSDSRDPNSVSCLAHASRAYVYLCCMHDTLTSPTLPQSRCMNRIGNGEARRMLP